jgi:hypothetical protein
MAASLPDHMQLADTESLAPKVGKVTLKSNFDRALALYFFKLILIQRKKTLIF